MLYNCVPHCCEAMLDCLATRRCRAPDEPRTTSNSYSVKPVWPLFYRPLTLSTGCSRERGFALHSQPVAQAS